MHILLFIGYAALLSFIVLKLPWLRRSPLKTTTILAFFYSHVAIGCLHTWIAWRFYPNHGDIWLFFNNSFNTRDQLQTSFSAFWADNHRLADLPHNLIEWLHVILNIASRDNLYINTLLFSFLTLGGYIALFEVVYRRLNGNIICAASALFLPSVLFWTSCIHTEGIVYPLLGWLVYLLDNPRRQIVPNPISDRTIPKFSGSIPKSSASIPEFNPATPEFSRVLPAFALTGLIIFLRPAIGIGLLPIPAIWIISTQLRSRRTRLAAALFGLICIAAISFTSGHFLSYLSAKQADFQTLQGGSRIPLPSLQPNAASFFQVLPTAILNGFFQPLPGSIHQPIYYAFFTELAAIWLIIGISLVIRLLRRNQTAANPLSSSNPQSAAALRFRNLATISLLFSIPCILLVGFIVPFVGAIVRYRSLYLPFFLLPFLFIITERLPKLNLLLTQKCCKE